MTKDTKMSKREILDLISDIIEEPINIDENQSIEETYNEVLKDGAIVRKYDYFLFIVQKYTIKKRIKK